MSDLRKFKVYRILLTEDDEQFAKFVLAALHRYNFLVRYAGDGRFALKCLKEEPFDLMLCDIAMPHVDGFKLLEKARAQKLKMPPVLMMTGLKEKEAVLRAKAFGAHGYIVKPASIDQILEKIKATLKIADSMLLDKMTMPFSVSCTKTGGELKIFLSGCPMKDPFAEIKQAIIDTPPRATRLSDVMIHVAPEFASDGKGLGYLDDLGRYLNKQLLIPWYTTRFTGKFFNAITLLERDQFIKDHLVVDE